VPEIGTPGLTSGDGKRGVGHGPQATAPILDSTVAAIARALAEIMSELETPQQHDVASGFILSETLGSSSGTALRVGRLTKPPSRLSTDPQAAASSPVTSA
jgi:hypothetical protein